MQNKQEPTLEQLREAETELNELLDRKKLVDRELQSIETRIFNLETTYLEDTSAYGNIIRGYEGYLTQKPMQKKVKAMDTDRLFSLSSTSYQKVCKGVLLALGVGVSVAARWVTCTAAHSSSAWLLPL